MPNYGTSWDPYRTQEDHDELSDAVQCVLDLGLTPVSGGTTSDDVFEGCYLCGQSDGHLLGCPVPVLRRWQQGEWPPKG